MKNKIIITGGSGFVGTHLSIALLEKGYKVVVFDIRSPMVSGVDFFKVNLIDEVPREPLEGCYAVIHLAGRNIFGRWGKKAKKAIYESRISSARNLISAIADLNKKPEVFISASATGIYGDRGEEKIDETSLPGDGFLAKVSVDWEEEAKKAERLGLRSVQIRTAPALGKGGFLNKILPIYKWGLGGAIGSGKQWFSWVHIDDLVNIYIFALENEQINGPVNACSPEPVRNKEFSDTLASVLHRSGFLKVPKWLIKLTYGEVSDVILASQKVYPKKVTGFGYKFSFPDIKSALEDII